MTPSKQFSLGDLVYGIPNTLLAAESELQSSLPPIVSSANTSAQWSSSAPDSGTHIPPQNTPPRPGQTTNTSTSSMPSSTPSIRSTSSRAFCVSRASFSVEASVPHRALTQVLPSMDPLKAKATINRVTVLMVAMVGRSMVTANHLISLRHRSMLGMKRRELSGTCLRMQAVRVRLRRDRTDLRGHPYRLCS